MREHDRVLHMYDTLLTMNGPDLLFEWCTHERYEALAHRRSRPHHATFSNSGNAINTFH
jgi:hypothetical protein